MQKKFIRKITVFITLLCTHLVWATEPVVKMVADPWPPWIVPQGNGKPSGFAIDIVDEIFTRLKIKNEITIVPFKRGLKMVEEGDADLAIFVSKNEQRSRYMIFTEPIEETQFLLYYSDKWKNFHWKNWQELIPFRIGIVRGFNYGNQWLTAVNKYKLNVQAVGDNQQLIKMLLLGRVDLAIIEFNSAEHFIENNPQYKGRITATTKAIFQSVNRLAISKKSLLVSQLEQINQVIREMKKEGALSPQ